MCITLCIYLFNLQCNIYITIVQCKPIITLTIYTIKKADFFSKKKKKKLAAIAPI